MPDHTDKLVARLRANGLIARGQPAGIRMVSRVPGEWRWRVIGARGADLGVGSREEIKVIALAPGWVITEEDDGTHVGAKDDQSRQA